MNMVVPSNAVRRTGQRRGVGAQRRVEISFADFAAFSNKSKLESLFIADPLLDISSIVFRSSTRYVRSSMAEIRVQSDIIQEIVSNLLSDAYARVYLKSKKDLIKVAYQADKGSSMYLIVLKEDTFENWLEFHDVNNQLEEANVSPDKFIVVEVVDENIVAEYPNRIELDL